MYHATRWGIEGSCEAVAAQVAPFGIGMRWQSTRRLPADDGQDQLVGVAGAVAGGDDSLQASGGQQAIRAGVSCWHSRMWRGVKAGESGRSNGGAERSIGRPAGSQTGSQSGCQRRQTPGDTERRVATLLRLDGHIRRRRATSRDGKNAPYKRGVPGSNPGAPTSTNASFEDRYRVLDTNNRHPLTTCHGVVQSSLWSASPIFPSALRWACLSSWV